MGQPVVGTCMMLDDRRPRFDQRRTHDPVVCGPVPYLWTTAADDKLDGDNTRKIGNAGILCHICAYYLG